MRAASVLLLIVISICPGVSRLTGCQAGAGLSTLRGDDGKIPSNGVREAMKDLCVKTQAAKLRAVSATRILASSGIVKSGLVVGGLRAQSNGWEIGVGPNTTMVDSGLAASLSTTPVREAVYCWKGLMAGPGF